MRKFTTVLAAMLLALSMMAMPAMADDAKTLEDLEQELQEAEDEVIRLTGVVADLEDDLTDAKAAVAVQQTVVDDLNDDLAAAERDLADAEADLAAAQARIAACGTGPGSNGCINPIRNNEIPLLTELANDADAVVKTIEGNIEEAENELVVLEAEMTRLEVLLDGDEDNVGALKELEDAKLAEAAALKAVNEYVPPTAEIHPGCKGIANAQAKVSKGNAPAALAAVADKLKCTA